MKKNILKYSTVIFTLFSVIHLSETSSANGPLGKSWNSKELISIENIDHRLFDGLLKKYVNDKGRVNYKSWKSSQKDKRILLQYLSHLSQANVSSKASINAKLAYWINAYNAVTIEGIIQVYPTTSIRNHTAKIFGYNIWQDLYLIVGNNKYSLENIEHQILRKMNEPRIHFAIVCASIGCPRLINSAYTTSNIQEKLSENATNFFSQRQNFRIDQLRKTIYMSSILDWFKEDFGSNQDRRMTYIKPYLSSSYQSLAVDKRMSISYLKYDWNLNKQ